MPDNDVEGDELKEHGHRRSLLPTSLRARLNPQQLFFGGVAIFFTLLGLWFLLGSSGPTEAVAVLRTKHGDIVLAFFEEEAPRTVLNFKQLVELGFYDNCVLYRFEPNFVLQGGGTFANGTARPSPFGMIPLEYNVPNYERTVSMARYEAPDTAASDFSIQLADNSAWLGPGGADEHGYAVFAEVVDGWDVVQTITKQQYTHFGQLDLEERTVMRSVFLADRALTEIKRTVPRKLKKD